MVFISTFKKDAYHDSFRAISSDFVTLDSEFVVFLKPCLVYMHTTVSLALKHLVRFPEESEFFIFFIVCV